MKSSEAASLMADESDVVYLDARHDFRSVSEDIRIWWPKVRPGGILAGHDYLLGYDHDTLITVKPAVDEFARHEGLLLFTTLDPYPTWFVFKPK
jgi:hypothetical protein